MLLFVDLIPREELKHRDIYFTTPEEFFLDDQLNFFKVACFPNMTGSAGQKGSDSSEIIPFASQQAPFVTVVSGSATTVAPIEFGYSLLEKYAKTPRQTRVFGKHAI